VIRSIGGFCLLSAALGAIFAAAAGLGVLTTQDLVSSSVDMASRDTARMVVTTDNSSTADVDDIVVTMTDGTVTVSGSRTGGPGDTSNVAVAIAP